MHRLSKNQKKYLDKWIRVHTDDIIHIINKEIYSLNYFDSHINCGSFFKSYASSINDNLLPSCDKYILKKIKEKLEK